MHLPLQKAQSRKDMRLPPCAPAEQVFLGPQSPGQWDGAATGLTSLHRLRCLCQGQERAPEGEDLGFTLALSPLAAGPSATPPPSLSLS